MLSAYTDDIGMKYLLFGLFLIFGASCGENATTVTNLNGDSSTTALTGWQLDTSLEVVTLTSPGKQASNYFANDIAYGDFNGDSEPDLAVSQYLGDTNFPGTYNWTDTGAVYVYYSINDSSRRGDADLILNAVNSNSSQFGRGLGAGDVNNDGITDLLVGAPNEDLTAPVTNTGSVYIFNGSTTGLPTSATQIVSEPSRTANSGFGYGIFVDDLDGDGYKELIVGSMLDDSIAGDAGSAWIIEGQSDFIYETSQSVELTLTGGSGSDYCGHSVWVHDFDGDGKKDIYVGCPREDTAGTDRGAVLVFYGTKVQGTWVNNAAVPDSTIVNPISANNDYFGSAIAVMDYDRDGSDDLIIGAYGADDSFGDSGAIYLYSDIQNDQNVDVVKGPPYINPYGAEYYGHSMTIGDTNLDGLVDLIVGIPLAFEGGYRHGKVGVHLNQSVGGLDFNSFGKEFYYDYHKAPTQSRTAEADEFGAALCQIDYNADGLMDLVVGARVDDTKYSNDGQVYVYYGRSSGEILNNPDVKINSGGIYNSGRTFGSSCLAMDIDRDGYVDLLIGSEGNDDNAAGAGSVHIFSGSSSGIASSSSSAFYGVGTTNYGFGRSLAKGDLDNDGFDDLIVGAALSDAAGTDRGNVYIFRSNSTTGVVDTSTLAASQIFIHTGSANSDYLGSAVLAYDYDGDGDLDLLAGASGDDDSAAAAGRVYIWRNGTSGANAGANTLLSNAAHTTTIDEPNSATNHLFGSALAKSLYLNTSYQDLFIGAEGDDTNGADAGAVHIYQGTSTGFDSDPLTLRGFDENPITDLNEYLGSAITIFDFNGDGTRDIFMGARIDDRVGVSSGSVYVKLR